MLKVERIGNLLSVTPGEWAQPVLGPHLNWRKKTYVPYKNRYEFEKEPLYHVTGGSLVTYGGLYERVCGILDQQGYPYETVDHRRHQLEILPEPNRDVVGALRPTQQPALDAIWTLPRALINCCTAWGKSEVISRACASYSYLGDRYPIGVVTKGRGSVFNLHDRFKSRGVDAGIIGCGKKKFRPVTVISLDSLEAADRNGFLSSCLLLLVDEVHRAAVDRSFFALSRVQKARMFGFTATPEGRHDDGEIKIESLFGPVASSVTYAEGVARGLVVPMTVVMVQSSGRAVENGSSHEVNREGVWRNDDRNAEIAQVARQLVSMGQTLILTQTIEHAVRIHEHLGSDWPLVYATHPGDRARNEAARLLKESSFVKAAENASDMPDDPVDRVQWLFARSPKLRKYRSQVESIRSATQVGSKMADRMDDETYRQVRVDFTEGRIPGVVATGVWSEAVDFPRLQFVIRAGAGASSSRAEQEAGRASRICPQIHKSRGVVVDFEDRFSDRLARRASQRITTYRKQGWEVVRHVPVEEAAEVCRKIVQALR